MICFIFLTLPAAASASHNAHAARATPVTQATVIAKSYWGATPCGGKFKVLTKQALPAGLAQPSDAWATFSTPSGANNLAAAPGTYTNCAINLARWRWPDDRTMRADWDMLCTTVVHEMGHLLGHAHDLTPGSIMAPVFTNLSAEPKQCRAARKSIA